MTLGISRPAAFALVIAALLWTTACGGSSTEPTKAYDIAALQSVDSVVGTGTEATLGRSVTVNYSGWLYDPTAAANKGSLFDTSVGKSAFTFALGAGQVITGWDQGVRGMKVGGKRTLLIPSSLGYGSRGSGPIPPNSALVFDIELLGVQ